MNTRRSRSPVTQAVEFAPSSSLAVLRAACDTRGLSAAGTRRQLLAHLRGADSLATPPAQEPVTMDAVRQVVAEAVASAVAVAPVSHPLSGSFPALPDPLLSNNSAAPQVAESQQSTSAARHPAASSATPMYAASATASLAQLPTAVVPRRTQERILAGEYVVFDSLLPEVLRSSPTSPSMGFSIQSADGTPFRLVDAQEPVSRATKRRVCDLSTWLEAWTTYLNVVLQAAPHRLTELLGYQAIIVEANRRYFADGWMDYDRQFRASAASSPQAKPWDVIDPNIWQLTTSGKTRPTCLACHLVHPPAGGNRCLFRASTSTTGPQATPVHGNRPICRNFNQQRCSGPCTRVHVCFNCRGSHPSASCPQGRKSTGTSKKAGSCAQRRS